MKAKEQIRGRDVKFKDHTGQVFGYLTVLRPVKKEGYTSAHWECRCVCGKIRVIHGTRLRNGQTRSCRCMRGVLEGLEHGGCSKQSPKRTTRLYNVWKNMKNRCYNAKSQYYYLYGGRGIIVCDRWKKFKNFLDDMGTSYQEGLSIDRINNDGNYQPDNCRWATPGQQVRNSRKAKMLTFHGETKCILDWCVHYGVSSSSVYHRIRRGWDPLKAITESLKLVNKT